MDRTFFLLALILIIPATLGISRRAAAQGTLLSWEVDGTQRQAWVFAPTVEKSGEKHPLIFAFHGHGGNMNRVARGMRFQQQWPEAIVVYPQGLPTPSRVDPLGLKPGWQSEAGQQGDRDLKFFDVMLSDLKKKYAVDESRIYAAGFSNGAMFSYLLWGERGKKLAAIGIAAGRMADSIQPAEPRPLIVIAGENDPVLPFSEQEKSIARARQLDHAGGSAQACGAGCSLYPSDSRTPVLTLIHPGGHVFPPWGSQAMANFFQQYSNGK